VTRDAVAAGPDIVAIASLLGDRARVAMLTALADGRALPASELAMIAETSRSTASEHLARLVGHGLLSIERCGRHAYYRVANNDVIAALEALSVIAPYRPPVSLRTSRQLAALSGARTCYDHVAGRLGVELAESLQDSGLVQRGIAGFEVDAGEWDRRAPLGVFCAPLCKGKRPLVRTCLDWSERRHHVAGALGAALAARLFELGWIRRQPLRSRALVVTGDGASGLDSTFGIRLSRPEPASLTQVRR
jgi:DNA-binding transcriptional ArsR family regulator